VLDELAKHVADRSFNCITIDGDTSTNDSFILIASGKSSLPAITSTDSPAYAALRDAVTEVAQELAQLIVRDGEGATKFMTITVEGGKDAAECRQIAYAIGHSPLVKTAFYASDPNLGRILAAIGYAGVTDLDVGKIDLYLDDVLVAKSGGRNPEYKEEDGQRVMKKSEIAIRVLLGRGTANATIWTCDLSHDYVSINADYRSQKRRASIRTWTSSNNFSRAPRRCWRASKACCRRRRPISIGNPRWRFAGASVRGVVSCNPCRRSRKSRSTTCRTSIVKKA